MGKEWVRKLDILERKGSLSWKYIGVLEIRKLVIWKIKGGHKVSDM